MAYLGLFSGQYDGKWFGYVGGGSPPTGDMAAVVSGAGSISAQLSALASISAALVGEGVLGGPLAGLVSAQATIYGLGGVAGTLTDAGGTPVGETDYVIFARRVSRR